MTMTDLTNKRKVFFQKDVHTADQIERQGFNLQTIAKDMKVAQDQNRQIAPFTSWIKDFGNIEAYAVANMIHKMRMNEGAKRIGRKIGFTNSEMWSVYGVHEPIWSYIYDTTVVRLNSQNTKCHIGRFSEPKIEPEVVLHFCSTPSFDAEPTEILDCIDWIAHGIEIVQCHFPGWKFKTADTIADSGLHAKLYVGEPQKLKNPGQDLISKLESFSVSLSCDGIFQEQGTGSNVLGSPLKAVSHLIKVIANYPGTQHLQAGELVTTGTLTTAFTIKAGQKWNTNLSGINIPGISIQFDI